MTGISRRLLLRSDAGGVAAFLAREETANTFMLGNLLYFGAENNERMLRCGDYWGYWSGDTLVGVVAYYNNSQCMVYFTDEAAARPIGAQISQSPIRLVLGSERCVAPLAPHIRGVPGNRVVRRQIFMERAEAWSGEGGLSGGQFEDARRRIGSWAVQDFVMRCMKDCFGYTVSRGTVRRLLKEKTRHEPYLLLRVGGKYVAQAHVQSRTPGFCQIGGVCTLPEERRRGYARAVVTEMMGLIAQDGGRRACLVVNEDNVGARRLYDELGFRETQRLTLIDFL